MIIFLLLFMAVLGMGQPIAALTLLICSEFRAVRWHSAIYLMGVILYFVLMSQLEPRRMSFWISGPWNWLFYSGALSLAAYNFAIFGLQALKAKQRKAADKLFQS